MPSENQFVPSPPAPSKRASLQPTNVVMNFPGRPQTATRTEPVARPKNKLQLVALRLGRSMLYSVVSFPLVLLILSIAGAVTSTVFGLLFTGVGLLLLAPLLRSAGIIGGIERAILSSIMKEEIDPPVRSPKEPGWRGMFLAPLSDASYWREVGFFALRAVAAPSSLLILAVSTGTAFWQLFLVAPFSGSGSSLLSSLTFGLASLVVGWALVLVLTAVQVNAAHTLLGPDPKTLSARTREAEYRRDLTAAAAEAERRKIERDLHDGAQARLSTVALDLGRAKHRLDKEGTNPDVAEIIDTAHRDAKQAIVELRNLARGIHPAVLSDRGLDAALSEIAARCAVPVHLDIQMSHRPDSARESAAYFAVSELLTNITKHSKASQAWVTVRGDDTALTIQVSDNGVGGADAALGSGLYGLDDRIRGIGGTLRSNSPLGEGTTTLIELPL